MANIFKQNLDVTQHPNRNNHDLSHKVHGTYKMGYLYPFLCQPVVPSDTFKIDTACAFQLMPMPFPTQSKIRCIFHYFYVRNKNIWENWENWLQGLESHTPPYIDQPASFYKTGSLADYLGIPSTLVHSSSTDVKSDGCAPIVSVGVPQFTNILFNLGGVDLNAEGLVRNIYAPYHDISQISENSFTWIPRVYFKPQRLTNVNKMSFSIPSYMLGFKPNADFSSLTPSQMTNFVSHRVKFPIIKSSSSGNPDFADLEIVDVLSLSDLPNVEFEIGSFDSTSLITVSISAEQGTSELADFISKLSLFDDDDHFIGIGVTGKSTKVIDTTDPRNPVETTYDPHEYGGYNEFFLYSVDSPSGIVDISEVNAYPYYSSSNNGEDTVKISALPFRAYESCVRAFYKNSVLQPLMINGEPKYNRYNHNLGDGADTFNYELEQRNWELDAYTSCLPSPQQGNMPLVGITENGDGRAVDPDTGDALRFHVERDGDREDLVVDGGGATGSTMRALVNLRTSGITIPDIRETNALQRFLEQSIRTGYRYIDFVKGHFGNEPKYAELDMPEFLGGFSQAVDVNMISNSNGVIPDGSSEVLGSFAGQARAFGGSKHGITRYFDDYGFVIGIMCIVPDAAYTQLLPKHFTYNDRLDYFFPEFSQLGMQPVTFSEVCPIQSHYENQNNSNKKLTDTFGYQRPNHELVWIPDSLHGQFRTSLNDYVVNRVFQTRPELSDQFLKIDPDDTNRIFSVTEDDNDVVVGQIALRIIAKRPVPRIVIPSLGH